MSTFTRILPFFVLLFFTAQVSGDPIGWGEDVQLTNYSLQAFYDLKSAQDSQGNIYIVWLGSCPAAGYVQVCYMKISPNGKKLIVDTRVTDSNTVDYYGLDVIVDYQDNIIFLWSDYRQYYPIIYYTKKDATGQTLIGDMNVTSPFNQARFPTAAVDSQDNLHIVFELGSNYPDVGYTKVDSEGQPLVPEMMVYNSEISERPSIGVDSNDHVHIAWAHVPNLWTQSRYLSYVKLDNNGNTLIPLKDVAAAGNFSTLNAPSMLVDSKDHLLIAYNTRYTTFPSYANMLKLDNNANQLWSAGIGQVYDLGFPIPLAIDSGNNIFSTFPSYSGNWGVSKLDYAKIASTGNFYTYQTLSQNQSLVSRSVVQYGLDNKLHVIYSDNRSGVDQLYLLESKPAPVLLVHGIYSDDSIWDQTESLLWQNGYTPFRVGKMLGQNGLIPNNGDIHLLKDQVKDAIRQINNQLGTKKVDVIAHSMGGLVTRAYIASNNYANDVNHLLMLGTPNEGASLARDTAFTQLIGLLGGDEFADIARFQLIPNSFFLNVLNRNYTGKSVKQYAIAGTRLFNFPFRLPICIAQPSFCIPFFGVSSDSIVPVSSVQFSSSQCYLDDVVHSYSSLLLVNTGPSYYTNGATINQMIQLLRDDNSSLQGCPSNITLPPANRNEVDENMGLAPAQQVSTILNIAGPSDALITSISSTYSPFGAPLSLQLPSGNTITPNNYTSFSGVQYSSVSDGNTFYQEYQIDDVRALGITTGDVQLLLDNEFFIPIDYNAYAIVGRAVSTQPYTDKTEYSPGELMIVSTKLWDYNANVPVTNATVSTSILRPDNTNDLLLLYDDGNHSDDLPNDGVYANTYDPRTLSGLFIMDITANGQYQSVPFTLQEKTSSTVVIAPDLSISNPAITFSNSYPGKNETITISARVRNIGNEDVVNAFIDFYEGEPANGGVLIGQQQATIPAGQQTSVSIPFMGGEGKHTIVVFPSPSNSFLDQDYTNEKASQKITFCLYPIAVKTGKVGMSCLQPV